MNVRLSEQHLRDRSEFVDFVRRHVAPVAQAMDDDERLFPGVMEALADAGYFGAIVPSKYGGRAMDAVSAGLLVEAVAAVSPSVASVVTVNWMVAESLLRFGTESQRERWLPGIAAGKQLASFALSEPEIGSDARGVTSRAERTADGFRLSGSKTWITGARIASIALVIVQCDGEPTAVMVDLKSPDVCIEPVEGLLGHRSSMLGTVSLRGCEVGKDAVVGKAGAGVDFIAQSALHIGRLCVAWASLGIADACRRQALLYGADRRQFGVLLKDHQLVKRLVADMTTGVATARLLCLEAARLTDEGHPDAVPAASMAKYHASRVATSVSSDAVRIHGAAGCTGSHIVQRLFRDAQIMEVIEGTTEIQQLLIAHDAFSRPDSGYV